MSRDEHTFLGDEAQASSVQCAVCSVQHIVSEQSGKHEGEGHKMACEHDAVPRYATEALPIIVDKIAISYGF